MFDFSLDNPPTPSHHFFIPLHIILSLHPPYHLLFELFISTQTKQIRIIYNGWGDGIKKWQKLNIEI